jgi:uncharacterized membrane protein
MRDSFDDRIQDHLLGRLVLAAIVAWLGLFAWNSLIWAIVTVTAFVLIVGFWISRSILDVRGPVKIAVSTMACGTGTAVIVGLIFYWVCKL